MGNTNNSIDQSVSNCTVTILPLVHTDNATVRLYVVLWSVRTTHSYVLWPSWSYNYQVFLFMCDAKDKIKNGFVARRTMILTDNQYAQIQ